MLARAHEERLPGPDHAPLSKLREGRHGAFSGALRQRAQLRVGQQHQHPQKRQQPRREERVRRLHLTHAAVFDVRQHGARARVVGTHGQHGLVGPLVQHALLSRALGLVERHGRLPAARIGVLGGQPHGAAQERQRGVHGRSIG